MTQRTQTITPATRRIRPVTPRRALAVACLALLAVVGWVEAETASGPSAPIFPLEEVHRGLRGYGLSVFAGTEPQRFEVEVVGIMRNNGPERNFILARLSGQGLESTGVAAGMSGSPVYFDGRLAGAVAFSWPFAREAIAGITPIAGMRAICGPGEGIPASVSEGALASASGIGGPGRSALLSPRGPLVPLADLLAGRVPDDLLSRELGRLQPATLGDATAAVSWMGSGFGPASEALLRSSLGSFSRSAASTFGGSVTDGEFPELGPGSVVTAVLVEGDLSLAANGTVTERDGDRVLAFGHQFLGAGTIDLPMAVGEVTLLVSNLQSSFKLANAGPIIGAFHNDEVLGIEGRIGAEPPMIPLHIRFDAGTGGLHDYRMRVTAMPSLAPPFIASAVLGSIESAGFLRGEQGIDLDATFRLAGHEPVQFALSADGPIAPSQIASQILAFASYLIENDLAQVTVEDVELTVRHRGGERARNLVTAHADRRVVRPGETVRVFVDLVGPENVRSRETLDVVIPTDAEDGPYWLMVGDGTNVDAARLTVEPRQPRTLAQALDVVRGFHSRLDLVVLGLEASGGLTVDGTALPRLPASAATIFLEGAPAGDRATRLAVTQEVTRRLESPIDGVDRIDLEVRRDATSANRSAKRD